ncbi:MAG: SMP-30/gluconolactonase/LRE family protein [Spirosomataceae bacterium]
MKKRYILAVIVTLIGVYVVYTLLKANVFKPYETTQNAEVNVIVGPPGMEDITIDTATGYAYISSHDRRNFESRGNIYLYDINDPGNKFVNLTADFPKQDFRPHGISLFIENDSTKFLFVISHRIDSQSIERFKIEGASLKHLDTFKSTEFISPNDIHAISSTEFYLTNDHGETKGFMRTVKDFLKIGTGSVVYFDGNSGKIVATGIPYANGIHTSKDGKKLFIASTNVNEILVFNRNADNTLKEETVFDTGIGVDNIELDNAGNLSIGCHPQLLKFLSHSKDSKNLSPTVVLKMTYNEDSKTFKQETIYTDDGSNLSGGSVAAPYIQANGKQIILAGSVFERKMLVLK